MHVYYDISSLSEGHSVRGIGFYNRRLIEALQLIGPTNNTNILTSSADRKVDIIHYPHFDLFSKTLDLTKNTKSVVTVYDCIPLLYPNHYPPGIKGKVNFLLQNNTLHKADAIVTISETSKKDIIRYLKIDPKKIHVIYSGPGNNLSAIRMETTDNKLNNVLKKYNLPDKYILYVGDVNYNKNVINLVKAAKILDIPLVLVGKQISNLENELGHWAHNVHPEIAHFTQLISEINSTKLVYRPGFVDDDDLNILWSYALCYCQPSLYEGFGLSLLESFWAETPVVASYTQALVEVGGDAALYFNPNDPNDIANTISKVVTHKNITQDLVKYGISRRKLFTWEQTANKLINVYRMVAKN